MRPDPVVVGELAMSLRLVTPPSLHQVTPVAHARYFSKTFWGYFSLELGLLSQWAEMAS